LEDSKTGVQSGLQAGAQVIAIATYVQMQEHQNLRYINSLSEINLEKLVEWYPFLDRRVETK
jgi:beta-phosphoglucomutase-like phosphatase (HAD superfamily)